MAPSVEQRSRSIPAYLTSSKALTGTRRFIAQTNLDAFVSVLSSKHDRSNQMRRLTVGPLKRLERPFERLPAPWDSSLIFASECLNDSGFRGASYTPDVIPSALK